MCDFIENEAIKKAVEQAVPVSMPRSVGALGFDIPFWVGLGVVGLWAALDEFSTRACLKGDFPTRFPCQGNEGQSLEELDDIRHLYAHYAGETNDEYFDFRDRRRVLCRGVSRQLTCGAQFNGNTLSLDLSHLRNYAHTVQCVLERFC
jgi:hypothetical protein